MTPRLRARKPAIGAVEVDFDHIVKSHRTTPALGDRPMGRPPIGETDPAGQPVDRVVVVPLRYAPRDLQVPRRGPLAHDELRTVHAGRCGHRFLTVALDNDPANRRQVVRQGLRAAPPAPAGAESTAMQRAAATTAFFEGLTSIPATRDRLITPAENPTVPAPRRPAMSAARLAIAPSPATPDSHAALHRARRRSPPLPPSAE